MSIYPALPQLFESRATELAAEQAFLYHRDGEWRTMSWHEYQTQVLAVASFLLNQGVRKGDRVAILSANRPEWMIVDLAILWIGAVSVPIYATSSIDDVKFIAQHSGAKIFFVDNPQRASALESIDVSAIGLFDEFQSNEVADQRSPCYAYAELLSQNKSPKRVEVKAEDIATIIYTSGTTGTPKGVVHSHGNMMAVMTSLAPVLAKNSGERDRFFSFLPLSHVAERVLVQIGSIMTGSEVAFARSVSTLGEDLGRCRPTILLCVPRLWEKMHERILIGLKNASLIQRLIFRMAKWAGSTRIHGDWITQKKICGLATWVSEFLVGRKLRTKLGLDRARLLVTGSAPTRREVVEFFASFGLFIREVYGLSENLCLGVYQPSDRLLLESCGKAFMGNEVKIAGDGEILFRAPWLFKEYFRNPDASQDTMQGDWFATGDLGRLDERGFLYIVGRKKELLKTSTGKYVAPVPIEDQLKCLDVVTEAMLVGDNEKYCVALISISPNTSEDRLKDAILPHLESMNAKLAHHESIKRIGVLCKDFSVESGTLTPTLKLKRKNAFDQNKEFIRQIYEAKDTIVWQQS